MKLHVETVSAEMMSLLVELMKLEELKAFRLVGGTALSLQFGHRKSVDIDLFAGGGTEPQGLPKIMDQYFGKSFELSSQNRNGIVARINGIKVDIVDWKVPFSQEPMLTHGIRIATAPDIFASKCEAILDRKAEKDFVDISMISSQFDLEQLFITLKTRYHYITTGAISAFLLKRELIERDLTIQYLENYSFDFFADQVQRKVIDFEKSIEQRKQTETNDREKKIQSLIDQKRKKENP